MSENQDACMARIEPLLPVLYDALRGGMKFYQDPANYSPIAVAQQRSRTAKGCVYDHAFHLLREKLDGAKGHHFRSIRGLEILNYFDQAVIRLKQVNGSGKSRNYPTQQQRDYDDQRSFLPHIPDEAVRLVAGYEPDTVFSTVDRIIISRPLGRTILWSAQINRFDGATTWTDITPARIPGTNREDFDADRKGRRA